MKHHLSFLLGSAAAVLSWSAVQAAPVSRSDFKNAQSYAELLEPIPNATSVLLADDLARAQQPKPLVKLIQYHHHHHHHHHQGFFPGFGIVAPPFYVEPDCYIRRRVFINRGAKG